MNSPMYLAVIIHPDNPPEERIQTVSYAERREIADGMAMRAWKKAQAEWASTPDNEKNEPPFHDVYICERRLREA